MLNAAMTQFYLQGSAAPVHATALGPSDLPYKYGLTTASKNDVRTDTVAQKRTKSLTFEYRFTSSTRKHSFDFLTTVVP